MFGNKVLFLALFLSVFSISESLKCHTCIYEKISEANATFEKGDKKCKNVTKEKCELNLLPCNEYSDALNSVAIFQKILKATEINQVLVFTLGCAHLKIERANKLDVVIRGCIGNKQGIYKYLDEEEEAVNETEIIPTPVISCERPVKDFWDVLREGELSLNNTPIDTTSANIEACMCNTEDGCNVNSSCRQEKLGILILVAVVAFMMLVMGM